ncbi:TetR/AcrR family transcriptional regulator [Stutzerimonas frequens]|uniref:TetR/AcrR family transcriptional regulator n=1 Tax=Stutzerimonas frequens TaxID=2968969 RepID=UPI000D7E5DCC|nr:TetR/AcrR family transcriptional regulator [Stutzerimonas frequens]AWT10063.1 TetR/AcrR family transcriptional regulator [Stutzerimonas frequens]
MTLPRGRPAKGRGLSRVDIIHAALQLLQESGEQGLTMRSLAARLGTSPMALYRHIEDRAGLIRALSDHVYATVLDGLPAEEDAVKTIAVLLTRYHDAVCQYPQLTLAIFALPHSFTGVTRRITDRLTACIEEVSERSLLWRDILIDHLHGSALAFVSARGDSDRIEDWRRQYQLALHLLLERMVDA